MIHQCPLHFSAFSTCVKRGFVATGWWSFADDKREGYDFDPLANAHEPKQHCSLIDSDTESTTLSDMQHFVKQMSLKCTVSPEKTSSTASRKLAFLRRQAGDTETTTLANHAGHNADYGAQCRILCKCDEMAELSNRLATTEAKLESYSINQSELQAALQQIKELVTQQDRLRTGELSIISLSDQQTDLLFRVSHESTSF